MAAASDNNVLYGGSGSARKALAITPDDANDLANVARALLISAEGDLKVTMADDLDTAPVVLPVQKGYNPIQVKRVWLTSKTCGNVFALR